MLAPSTVMTLARSLQAEAAAGLTFLDLLLVCAQTDDCEPLIPVDFEELEDLGEWLTKERSILLAGSHREIQARFGVAGRRLLAIVKTALVVRAWTRLGSTDVVADTFGCYAFEVRRLSESVERILTAAVAVLTPRRELAPEASEAPPETTFDDGPPLPERVRALTAMVSHGVDEQVVTLTFLDGIGGILAARLRDAGIADIEELALSDTEELAKVRGVSAARAARWIAEATDKTRACSAFSMRETGRTTETASDSWNSTVDPYRFRRALDLKVRRHGDWFTVTGGLEPHRVKRAAAGLGCDCADFANGRACKHVLAVRLHCKDAYLLPLVERLSSQTSGSELDLFHLWFDGGKR